MRHKEALKEILKVYETNEGDHETLVGYKEAARNLAKHTLGPDVAMLVVDWVVFAVQFPCALALICLRDFGPLTWCCFMITAWTTRSVIRGHKKNNDLHLGCLKLVEIIKECKGDRVLELAVVTRVIRGI